MRETQERAKRKRAPARPRMNTKETGNGESWFRRAIMRYSEAAAIVGECPADPDDCGWCGSSRCGACDDRNEWDHKVLSLVSRETNWTLFRFGCAAGKPFASAPSVYRPRKHPKFLVVTWMGGLDI